MTMRVRATLAAASAGVLMLSGCGFTGLYGAPLPGGADLGNNPFTVTAYFTDALDLVPQSAVKVNDTAVGKVTKISLDGWSAKVTMEVNDSVKLPANATAEIAQTSLLGEKYVSLNPPATTPSQAELKNGAVIKLDHTRSAAEVEQVLGALSLLLNEGGLRQIRTIGRELIDALKGNEPNIKSLLGRLNTFVGTLNAQKTDITDALDGINKLAITLNQQKKVLTDALDTFPAALKVLADERTKFTALLTSLDRLGTVATDVINNTQTNLVTSLKALEPTLQQLRASGDAFPQSLRIFATFPFPLGTTRELVKGDYANLSAYLNLDIGETFCQFNEGPSAALGQVLCNLLKGKTTPDNPFTANRGTAKSAQGATGNSADIRRLKPVLIESGR